MVPPTDKTPAVAHLDTFFVWAIRQVRRRAVDSENVFIEEHAYQTMAHLEVFDTDVFHVLHTGTLEGEPTQDQQGGVKCKLAQRIRGRKVIVTVDILPETELIVSNVEVETRND